MSYVINVANIVFSHFPTITAGTRYRCTVGTTSETVAQVRATDGPTSQASCAPLKVAIKLSGQYTGGSMTIFLLTFITPLTPDHPAHTKRLQGGTPPPSEKNKRSPNVGVVLGQRLRLRFNTTTALGR